MPTATLTIHLDEPGAVIRPELYGHFAEHLGACVDEGLWVGPDSAIPNLDGLHRGIVEALRKLSVPVLRWPGGCFADDYHWQHGVGPRRDRPRTVNLHWGQGVETNAFGTHEFLHLCRLLGAAPYLAGNLGSGTVAEMRDWVEYCNFAGDSTLARRRAAHGSPDPFAVRYWGVGNENWGCGGSLGPEDYAAEYKRYATYLRDFSGAGLFLIACGPDCGGRPQLHADWTRRFFQALGDFPRLHGFGAHYYCGTAGTATEYDTGQWYELIAKAARVEQVIATHRAIMDEFERGRKVKLLVDEWGAWHPPTPGKNPLHLWQQNTLRDALVAAVTLDTFNRRAGEVAMGNLAQMVNVLQAMVLSEGERVVTTPTYHVFDLYQTHQGGQSLRVTFECGEIRFTVGGEERRLANLSGSASLKGGVLTLSVVNPHAALPAEAVIRLRGRGVGGGGVVPAEASVSVLTHDDLTAHNTFEEPEAVVPRTEEVEWDGDDGSRRHVFPPASVSVLRARVAG